MKFWVRVLEVKDVRNWHKSIYFFMKNYKICKELWYHVRERKKIQRWHHVVFPSMTRIIEWLITEMK